MTQATTIDLSWKIRQILHDALGDDFAVTNSGTNPRTGARGAWFDALAGPPPLTRIRVELLPDEHEAAAKADDQQHNCNLLGADDICLACARKAGLVEGLEGELVPAASPPPAWCQRPAQCPASRTDCLCDITDDGPYDDATDS